MLEKIIEFCEGKNGVILSSGLLVMSFIFHSFGVDLPVDLIWGTIIISGFPFVYNAIRSIMKFRITNSILIAIALVASVWIGELFAAAEIALLMALGELLESYTESRAKKGLLNLLSLKPKTAMKLINNNGNYEIKEVLVSELDVDDVVRILPGEKISVDGIIIDGFTSVDQAILTGESIPVDKNIGDEVFCGTINFNGSIDVKVTKKSKETALQKLIDMVRKAEKEKAPIQNTVDRVAKKFVPTALLVALITFVIMHYLGYAFNDSVTRAVTVLVVFCPCALFLSTPTTIMAAVGNATKKSVIIKNGTVIENMARVTKIAFDKTGTITQGKLKVTEVLSLSEKNEDEILKITTALESKSEHPIAKSFIEYANNKNITGYEVSDFEVYSGLGIVGKVNGEKYYCGNENFINKNNIMISKEQSKILFELKKDAKTFILLTNEKNIIAVIAFSDQLKVGAEKIIKELKDLDVEPILLTGDNKTSARYFGEKIGINNIKSELLPENKLSEIKNLKEKNVVCMIGDGINDAPALKLSDVSIAMGKMGSDIAIETADVVLIGDDLEKVVYFKKLSNITLKTIKINLITTFTISVTAIILSALGFLSPIVAAFVHNFGTIIVVVNSAILYDKKI